MPRISKKKTEKIQEQIIHYLYSISPQSQFTSKIAEEIARDEEFIKMLLSDLKSKSIVAEINKNPSGVDYKRRQRWRLTSQAFEVFKKHTNP